MDQFVVQQIQEVVLFILYFELIWVLIGSYSVRFLNCSIDYKSKQFFSVFMFFVRVEYIGS